MDKMNRQPTVPIPDHTFNVRTGSCNCHSQTTYNSGHYHWIPGEIISGGTENARYGLMESLGQGGYGHVIRAVDVNTHKPFALKIIKNLKKYYDAGLKEIEILNMLNTLDPKQEYISTKTLCQFELDGHICFGMELLGLSLHDYMKMNKYLGFPVHQIRHILYQLVHAVQFLHTNDVIHSDIKLENILFAHPHTGYSAYLTPPGGKYVAPKCTRVLLTDFGAAKAGGGSYVGLITTRTTLAPEVILGKPWSFSVDVWALACVLFQLYTGILLFAVWDDVTQLYLVEQVTGPLSKLMTESGPLATYFKGGRVDTKLLKAGVKTDVDLHAEECNKQMLHGLGDAKFRRMVDLFYLMLKNDPAKRIATDGIMKHGFIEELPVNMRLQHGLANLEAGLHCCPGFLTGVTCGCEQCRKYQ